MEQQTCHFQVIDSKLALVKEGYNVGWPFEAPNTGPKCFAAQEPDTPSPMLAGITVANVGRHAWDQLATQCGSLAHDNKHGPQIPECVGLG